MNDVWHNFKQSAVLSASESDFIDYADYQLELDNIYKSARRLSVIIAITH